MNTYLPSVKKTWSNLIPANLRYGAILVLILTLFSNTQGVNAQNTHPFHGFYFGVGGGHISSERSGTNSIVLEAIPYNLVTGEYSQSGSAIGVHLGYNHVLPSKILLGLNVSSFVSDVQGEYIDDVRDGIDQFTSEAWHRLENITTAEGRIGYAKQSWSVYGAGGYAISMARNDANFSRLTLTPAGPARLYGSWTDEEPQSNWTLGAGAAYMISDKVSLGIDYDYQKINADQNGLHGSVGTFQTGSVPINMKANIRSTIHFVKLGISYQL